MPEERREHPEQLVARRRELRVGGRRRAHVERDDRRARAEQPDGRHDVHGQDGATPAGRRRRGGRVEEGAAFMTPGRSRAGGRSSSAATANLGSSARAAPRRDLLLAEEARFLTAADEAGPGRVTFRGGERLHRILHAARPRARGRRGRRGAPGRGRPRGGARPRPIGDGDDRTVSAIAVVAGTLPLAWRRSRPLVPLAAIVAVVLLGAGGARRVPRGRDRHAARRPRDRALLGRPLRRGPRRCSPAPRAGVVLAAVARVVADPAVRSPGMSRSRSSPSPSPRRRALGARPGAPAAALRRAHAPPRPRP